MNILTFTPRLLIVIAIVATCAHAADINWGAPQQISGDSNVSTNGSLIGAFNLGDLGVPSTTVNGVTFQSFAAPGANGTSGNFTLATASGGGASNTNGSAAAAPFNTLSAAYQTLLSSYIATLFTSTLTISGLTIGMQYEFQVWSNRSSIPLGSEVVIDGGNNSTFLSSNPSATIGGMGQWVRGTFTADAATQMIGFSGDEEVGGYLNAFQLRQLQQPSAVPEGSSTIALLGVAIILLGWLHRQLQARS